MTTPLWRRLSLRFDVNGDAAIFYLLPKSSGAATAISFHEFIVAPSN
jgi:hypothetical protein